jgi:DNA-binding response OmpR family regulator
MRALVVEDEAKIAAFIRRGLEAEGFSVHVASDGVQALARVKTSEVDVVVLDLMLPGIPGEEVLRRLREGGSTVPVIVLTGKDAVSDRVANLEAGADDYVVKPFSLAELVARIRTRVRGRAGLGSVVLSAGGVTLDVRTREARVGDHPVGLTSREFALLEAFMRHPGQVLSQPQLLDLVWGYDFEPGSNVVEVYVRRLRRKLGGGVIETMRGGGYRLREVR